MAYVSSFQCSRVGRPWTFPKSSRIVSSQAVPRSSFNLLSFVDRRLIGLPPSPPSRLSELPCTLRGGVSGEARRGRSVGLRTAGTYIGDFGGRSWRVAKGKLGNMKEDRGDEGEKLFGVPDRGSTGEYGWFPCEFGGVVYTDEEGSLVDISTASCPIDIDFASHMGTLNAS